MSTQDVSAKVTADISGFKKGMESAAQETAKLGEAASTASGGLDRLDDSQKRVGVTADGVTNGLGDLRQMLSGSAEAALSLAGRLPIAVGVIGAAGAGVFALAKYAAGAADEIGRMAQRVGVSAETMSEFQYAARVAGVSASALEGGLSAVRTAADEDAVALKAMGVATHEANGAQRESTALLADVAQWYVEHKGSADAAAVAQEALGGAFDDMLPLLNQGAAGLAELTGEARVFGSVISDELAVEARAFNEDMSRLQGMLPALAVEIGGPMVSAVRELADEFLDAKRAGLGFMEALTSIGLSNPFDNYGEKIRDVADTLDRMRNGAWYEKPLNIIGGKGEERRLEALLDFYKRRQKAEADAAISADNLDALDRRAIATAEQRARAEAKAALERIKAQEEAERAARSAEQKREAAARKAAADAERAAAAYKQLTAELAGLDGSYEKDLQLLHAAFRDRTLEIDDYREAVEKLIARQPFARDLAKQQAQAEKEAAQAADELSKNLAGTVGALEERALSLEDELATYGQTEAQIAATTAQRYEEVRALAKAGGASDDYLANLDREIDARKRIAAAAASLEARQATDEAAKAAQQEWQRTADQIEDDLTDALMRGFEGGKDFAENFRDTLVNMFKTLVLRPLLQPVMQGVSGAIMGQGPGGAAGTGNGLLGNAQNAYSLYNAQGLLGQAQNAYSFYSANGAGTSGFLTGVGGGGQALYSGAMSTAPTAQMSMAPGYTSYLGGTSNVVGGAGVATAPSYSPGMGTYAAGAAGAMWAYQQTGSYTAGVAGGAAGMAASGAVGGAMAGTGAYAGATAALGAIPVWGWAALAVLAIAGDLAKGGTPHAGAAVFAGPDGIKSPKSYAETQALYANPADADGFGEKDFYKRRQQGMADALSPVAAGSAALLNKTLAAFDRQAGYRVGLAYSSDDDDKSRGRLSIIDNAGAEVGEFARKYNHDPAKGFEQFAADLGTSLRDALVAADLPGWADQMLTDLGDDVTLEALDALAAQFDAVNTAAAAVGPMLGLTAEEIGALASSADGIPAALALIDGYAATMFTDAERYAVAATQIAEFEGQFAGLGVTIPKTIGEFRALADGIDLTTEAGRDLYAGLLALAPGFAASQEALLTLIGTTRTDLAGILREGLVGHTTAEETAAALSETVIDGIWMATANDTASQVADLMIGGIINPAIQALVLGGDIAAAVSAEAVESVVAQITAKVKAFEAVMSDPAVTAAMSSITSALGSIGTTASRTPSVYDNGARTRAPSVYDHGSRARDTQPVQDAWRELLATITRETQDATRELGRIGLSTYGRALAGIRDQADAKQEELLGKGYMSAEVARRTALERTLAIQQNNARAYEGAAQRYAAMPQGTDGRDYQRLAESFVRKAATAHAAAGAATASLDALNAVLGQYAPAVQAWADAQTALVEAQNAAQATDMLGDLAREIERMGLSDADRALADINDRAEDYVDSLRDIGQATAENIASIEAWAQAMRQAATDAQAAAIAQERFGLLRQIMQATGDTASLRQYELDELDPLNRALQEHVWALEDYAGALQEWESARAQAESALRAAHERERGELQQTADRMGDFAKSIAKFRNEMMLGAQSPLSAQARAGEVARQFAGISARARAGDIDALETLQGISADYLDVSKEQAGSAEEYYRRFADVQRVLGDTEEAVVSQADIALAQMAALDAQVGHLIAINANVMGVAEAIRALNAVMAGKPVAPEAPHIPTLAVADAYKSVLGRAPEIAGLSYWVGKIEAGEQSLGTLKEAVAGSAQNADKVNALDWAIKQQATASAQAAYAAYADVLGRAPDSGGMAYWTQQIESGALSADKLKEAMAGAAKGADASAASAWLNAKKVPGFASGGLHAGGLRLVGEDGPELEVTGPARYWSAPQTAGLFAGGQRRDEALVAEIRALRAEVAHLRAASEATARNTHAQKRQLERWDGDGMPDVRGVA